MRHSIEIQPFDERTQIDNESSQSTEENGNVKTSKPTKATKWMCMILLCNALLLDQICATMLLPVLPKIIHPNLFVADNLNETSWNVNFTVAANGTKSQFNTLGLVFGIKGVAQLFSTPIVGILIDYSRPVVSLVLGLAITSIYLTIYAFQSQLELIFFCRVLQGFACSAFLTGAFAEIADLLPKSKDRRSQMAVANIATFVGGAIGPFYGGAAFQFGGREVTFLCPFLFIFICVFLLFFLRDRFRRKTVLKDKGNLEQMNALFTRTIKPTPIYKLAIDPYILITTLGLGMANFPNNCWYPTLPSWMEKTIGAEEWEQGLVWIPSAVFYVLGSALITWLCHRLPRRRYILAVTSLLLSASVSILLPFFKHLTPISLAIGISLFCTAALEVVLLPLLPIIVDARYSQVYGSVSSFSASAFSLASITGSFFAGYITQDFGFLTLNICIAVVSLTYAPLVLVIRRFS